MVRDNGRGQRRAFDPPEDVIVKAEVVRQAQLVVSSAGGRME